MCGRKKRWPQNLSVSQNVASLKSDLSDRIVPKKRHYSILYVCALVVDAFTKNGFKNFLMRAIPALYRVELCLKTTTKHFNFLLSLSLSALSQRKLKNSTFLWKKPFGQNASGEFSCRRRMHTHKVHKLLNGLDLCTIVYFPWMCFHIYVCMHIFIRHTTKMCTTHTHTHRIGMYISFQELRGKVRIFFGHFCIFDASGWIALWKK